MALTPVPATAYTALIRVNYSGLSVSLDSAMYTTTSVRLSQGYESAPARNIPNRRRLMYARQYYASTERNPRNRSALNTTNTLDNPIAAAASMGESKMPNAGYNTPAATGMSTTL